MSCAFIPWICIFHPTPYSTSDFQPIQCNSGQPHINSLVPSAGLTSSSSTVDWITSFVNCHFTFTKASLWYFWKRHDGYLCWRLALNERRWNNNSQSCWRIVWWLLIQSLLLHILSHFPSCFTHTLYVRQENTRRFWNSAYNNGVGTGRKVFWSIQWKLNQNIPSNCWCKQHDMIIDIKYNFFLTWRLISILWKTKMKKNEKKQKGQ